MELLCTNYIFNLDLFKKLWVYQVFFESTVHGQTLLPGDMENK